jgi:hypothetical protein
VQRYESWVEEAVTGGSEGFSKGCLHQFCISSGSLPAVGCKQQLEGS